VPQRYDGRVVVLKAEASIDTTAAWGMVAPDLRVQLVKGDHNTCLTTQVDSLGAQLRDVLREAQDRVPATPATYPNAGADPCEIPVVQTHTGVTRWSSYRSGSLSGHALPTARAKSLGRLHAGPAKVRARRANLAPVLSR